MGTPDFEAVSWHVLLAPEGTPAEIVAKLHGEMKRIMAISEIKQKIAGLGLIPIDIAPVADMRRYIKSEGEKWGALVRKVGLAGSQ